MKDALIQSLIRHLLTIVGGALMAKYGIDATAPAATLEVTGPAAVGGLSTIVGLGLSYLDKRKANKD